MQVLADIAGRRWAARTRLEWLTDPHCDDVVRSVVIHVARERLARVRVRGVMGEGLESVVQRVPHPGQHY